ncbi:MAG: GatB/YqeY domain-containing protein [Clostridia bacterium]
MKEELLQDLKEAMKNKDTLKKDTITMLRAAILQVEKDSQKTLNDDEICAIVAKEVKKRKESVKEYEDAGREDIANSLKQEVEILSKYLPEQLTEDEIEKLVVEAISESGATSPKDMGRVMSILRPKTAGKADGKLVSDIVKEKLANM